MEKKRCTYLCPLKCTAFNPEKVSAFARYWSHLSDYGCHVLVVDGSPSEIFRLHHQHWKDCIHIAVDGKYTHLNGKVNGIWTGLNATQHEKIILADDDIRYTEEDVLEMVKALDHHELIRPQNFFQPLHTLTKIDTARILINRAIIPEGDFPGTFGFRRKVALKAGPFDGDVLFDNEEMIRHLANFGADISYRTDFFIARLSPGRAKWLEQRPRQAYEDFVMTTKTLLFLLIIPAHVILLIQGKWRLLSILAGSIATGSTGLALIGIIKDRAWKHLPFHTSLFAPIWVVERSLSVYLAFYWKFVKGGYPFGNRLLKKGTGRAWRKKNHSLPRPWHHLSRRTSRASA